MAPPIVVDTSIAFSAIRNPASGIGAALFLPGRDFHVCEMMIVDLFKHKDKIVAASKLSEEEVRRTISARKSTKYEQIRFREKIGN